MNRSIRRTLAATAAGATILTAAVLVSQNTATADTPVSITNVTVGDTDAGGLTAFVPILCGVKVDFTDGSPSEPSAYRVLVTTDDATPATVGSYGGATAAPEDLTRFTLIAPCESLTEQASYRVTVREGSGSESAASAFSYAVVGHPSGISATSTSVKGIEGFAPGKPVTVSFKGGGWEPGLTYSTQVWVSETKNFTGKDFDANRIGGAALVGLYKNNKPVLTFTPPTTVAGKYVWYSVAGFKDGKAAYRFTFSAVPVHKLPAQPTSWVKAFGKQAGTARVNTSVKVQTPTFSSAGKAQKLRVQYQWFVTNKTTAIPGATKPSYLIPESLRGYGLSLRVTVADDDHAARVKWYAFGTVK